MPETIDGIPLHPLLVHVPVVFIPIAALLAIVWVVRPAWRSRLTWWVLGSVAIAWLGTLVAASAGESLGSSIRETHLVEEHEELAEGLEIFVWVLFVSTVLLLGTDRWGEKLGGTRRAFAIVATLAVVVGGAGATVMDVLAGHAGAKAAWSGYEQAKG
jgi:hypothetical protein